MKRNTGIDIVIPVYNALEDLKICVESIKKHTDLTLDRLVFIDDRSPDENVYAYLKSIEAPGIIVLQNEENQGFSGSVNRGLEFSDRDVLLLNTDTIVTARWVDKIVACAYSDPAIGTVTPFSNNATLCSIPNFCQENTVPYGLSIDEYAQVIEERSMRTYPRITVAVGFCMFIKREVVDHVGLFDKETFKKGYGEENDFCWRAEQMGYYHVLCDDTYIYHSGSASFISDEKKALIAEHEQIVLERYPKQHQRNAEYVRDNPHQYLRSNVDIFARLKNGKKNILYVLHMDFRPDANNSIGGTQFHVRDLTENFRREHNIFVFSRDEQMLRLTAYLDGEEICFKFYTGKKPEFQQFHDQELADIFREVLTAFDIDIVHVHHVQGLSFDVFSETKKMDIPLILSMHDFYYICPTTILLKNGAERCDGCSDDCAQCLNRQLGYAQQVSYVPLWRKKCSEMFKLCDMLITPSEAAKDIYTEIYPELEGRIRVIPHGMDPFEDTPAEFRECYDSGFEYSIDHAFEKDYLICGWAYERDHDASGNEVYIIVEDKDGKRDQYKAMPVIRSDLAAQKSDKYMRAGFSLQIPDGYFASGQLKIQIVIRNGRDEFHSEKFTVNGYNRREKSRRRIAFLGGLSESKGGSKAYEMIKHSGSKYDWYIIGGIGDPNLITLERKYVHKTDWYRRENIKKLLQQNLIDLVCILPICPETFCYTVSESELSGVPVLATAMGAIEERMRSEQTGWLIDADMPAAEIMDKIDSLFEDGEEYEAMREKVQSFRHRSIAEMCSDYAPLYNSFARREGERAEYDKEAIFAAYAMAQSDSSGYVGMAGSALARRVSELEATLMTINQSLEYKMLKFFNRENLPFKKPFKWLIGFAYRVYIKLKLLRQKRFTARTK